MSHYSSSVRRNFWIRAVAGITGDFCIGLAMGSACVWIIQAAPLGLFLSFVLWVLAVALALSFSQHVLYPFLGFALSDRKLNHGMDALASLVERVSQYSADDAAPLWRAVHCGLGRFAARYAAR